MYVILLCLEVTSNKHAKCQYLVALTPLLHYLSSEPDYPFQPSRYRMSNTLLHGHSTGRQCCQALMLKIQARYG